MPRPSMAAQRKEEILDAFERCILSVGIDATSLEMLADEAKMKRSILRHYIGNRDDIVCALSKRCQNRYTEQWVQTLQWLPESDRLPALLDVLFAKRGQAYVDQSIIGEAIFSQAKRLKEVKQHQQHSMDEFLRYVEQELNTAYPTADSEHIVLVAHGIYANYLLSESLMPLDMWEEVDRLKQVSLLLIRSFSSSA